MGKTLGTAEPVGLLVGLAVVGAAEIEGMLVGPGVVGDMEGMVS